MEYNSFDAIPIRFLKAGLASDPTTFILLNIGNSISYSFCMFWKISGASAGSCSPN